MSLKLNSFAQIITQPLNIHKFVVDIPGVTTAGIVVSSTSFPSEKLRYVTLHYQGEEIRYPTIPQNDHSWRFKVPESDSGEIRRQLDSLKSSWNQKTGILLPSLWKAVTVTARDLQENLVFKVILHGAWMIGRDNVELNNSDPTRNWEWDYEMCYQWLEDVDLSNSGSPNQFIQ